MLKTMSKPYMYYNDSTIIFFDDRFVKASEAGGNLFDQSLHYGYAVFEGLRSYKTASGVKIFKAHEHFKRMQYSCNAIGIPYPFNNQAIVEICYEVLQKNNLENAYLRPLVTCTPNMSLTKGKEARLMIAAWEWGAYLGEKLLRLKTSSFRRIAPASFKVAAKVSGHYVNSILATQEAKDQGFDEALLLDVDGFIAEGPGANVFIEKSGILYTPQVGSILPGITRATVLEICTALEIPVVEKQLTLQEMYAADSAFYCGTAAEIVGIQSVDDVFFNIPWNNTIGHTIQQAYKNLVLDVQPASATTQTL